MRIYQARRELEMPDDLVPGLIDDDAFVQTCKNNRRIMDLLTECSFKYLKNGCEKVGMPCGEGWERSSEVYDIDGLDRLGVMLYIAVYIYQEIK